MTYDFNILEQINLKAHKSYFVANMTYPYMEMQRGQIIDTRRNFVYEDLYQRQFNNEAE